MTRDELEEQIRSTLGEKLSQEQITSILESIQLDDDRKLKLAVTSDPRIFGDTANSTYSFESPGATKYSGAEFTEKTSTVLAIFGDIQPGSSYYDGDPDLSKYEAPEFSMDQIQVVAEQLDLEGTYLEDLAEEEYYRHDYIIHIYIPDEKSLDLRKPRSEAEARKIKLLDKLMAGKKVQRRVSHRSDDKKRNRSVYEDIELTEELEEELNGYVQKVEERTPLVSYQELLMADAKLNLMERLALQTERKISEEDLAIIADRIVSDFGTEFGGHKFDGYVITEVTSNPDVFAEKVIEREDEDEFSSVSSFTTPVYGDLEPGYYHSEYFRDMDEPDEEMNLSDFSMDGLQIAIVDTNDKYGYYDSRTEIQIYIPEEREYEIVSYKEMKEKPKSLEDLKMKKELITKIRGAVAEGKELDAEIAAVKDTTKEK